MAWVYVPASEASSSRSASSSATPTTPLLTWRGKPLSSRIWSREWMKGSFVRRLSGTTLTTSTAARGVDAFIASLPDSRVNRSLSQALSSASKMSDGSGPASRESFATLDPASSSWKTSRPSLFTDLLTSSERWPNSGMLQRGICFPLPTSAPPTAESVFSSSQYWPTPRTITGGAESAERKQELGRTESGGGELQGAVTTWQTPGVDSFRSRSGDRKDEQGLDQQARTWPTPNVPNGGRSSSVSNYDEKGNKRQIDLGAATSAWATPTGHDIRSGKGTQKRVGSPALNEQVDKWPSPRGEDSEQAGNHPDKTDSLTGAIRNWPTPTAQDAAASGGEGCIERGLRGDSLTTASQKWPTPTAAPDAPNTNSNQKTGETCLGDAARSLFSHLDPLTSTPGVACLPSDQTSPPLWRTPATTDVGVPPEKLVAKDGGPPELGHRMYRKQEDGSITMSASGEVIPQSQTLGLQATMWKTPHGMANTDQHGKTGGAGGEHQKQVMTWSTPRAACNVQNAKNLPPPSEGGRSSKPGLADQIQPATPIPGQPKAQLNPRFDEWLMGWPPGWTDFAPVATEWCHWRRRMRFALSRLVSGGRSARLKL